MYYINYTISFNNLQEFLTKLIDKSFYQQKKTFQWRYIYNNQIMLTLSEMLFCKIAII